MRSRNGPLGGGVASTIFPLSTRRSVMRGRKGRRRLTAAAREGSGGRLLKNRAVHSQPLPLHAHHCLFWPLLWRGGMGTGQTGGGGAREKRPPLLGSGSVDRRACPSPGGARPTLQRGRPRKGARRAPPVVLALARLLPSSSTSAELPAGGLFGSAGPAVGLMSEAVRVSFRSCKEKGNA